MQQSGGGKARAAFLGLGTMGYPMATHLAGAGHPLRVYNRTRKRAEAWVAANGGGLGETPAEAVAGAAFVFTCVGRDEDLREVVLGADGAFAGMAEGAVLIDHTTVSAELARELAETAESRGLGFLDAPVSGGQSGAESGSLTVMVGGDEKTFARVRPLIGHYAGAATLMGPVGSGQLTKMVNQICIAGLLQGLAEGLNFAMCAGLDAHRVVEVIAQGAAQSWQMDNRAETMLRDEFDFGFAVDWMRKDLGICFQEARGNGARLPVTLLVNQFYANLQARDGGRWDTSSLIRLLAED